MGLDAPASSCSAIKPNYYSKPQLMGFTYIGAKLELCITNYLLTLLQDQTKTGAWIYFRLGTTSSSHTVCRILCSQRSVFHVLTRLTVWQEGIWPIKKISH